jgi:hypothetical protein
MEQIPIHDPLSEENPHQNIEEDIELIKFDYIKSNYFRVITADGANASLAQKGKIFLSLFNERVPIPRQVTYETLPNQALGKAIESISREGLVREVEVGLLVDINVALAIRDVLTQAIQLSEQL